MKILVLGAGGNVSTGIIRSIRKSELNPYIIGACINEFSSGFAFCDAAAISPLARSKQFIPWLENFIDENKIELVLSGVEDINTVLGTLKNGHNGPKYLVSSIGYQNIFNNKFKTVEWLKRHSIAYPKTIHLSEEAKFPELSSKLILPFIVKPTCGKGSEDIHIIHTREDFEKIDRKNNYVAQEFIGDSASEYTCGIYKSKFGYTEVIIMKRQLKNGSTAIAEAVQDKDIFSYVMSIADAIKTIGAFNVQLRLRNSDGMPICFEINMRFSGTTPIRHQFGFKDCQVWIKETYYDRDFRSDFNLKQGVLIRYESETFLSPGLVIL